MRITFYISIILLLFSTVVRAKENKTPPNVLLIMVDDLNDYVGFLGGHPQAKTPNMDRLASKSVIFTNAHSNNPVCGPSRASLFSGIHPHQSLNFGFAKYDTNPILMGGKSMMEYFKENGYHVTGTGKLMHHHSPKLFSQYGKKSNYGPFAFDGTTRMAHPNVPEAFGAIGALDGTYAPLSDVPTTKGAKGWGNVTQVWPKLLMEPFKYNNETDRDLTPDEINANIVENWLKKWSKEDLDKPFFTAVGFIRPHTPLIAPKKYFDMYPLDKVKIPESMKEGDKEDTHYHTFYGKGQKRKNLRGAMLYNALIEGFDDDKDLALRTYMQAYLACVSFTDDLVGQVLDALEKSDFADNTIVMLISDHGYVMGEKDYLFKNAPWEKATRIPMLVHQPKQKKSKKVNHPVSLIDVYPTLKDMCDLKGQTVRNEKGKELGGHSLKPFITGKGKWTGQDYAISSFAYGAPKKIDQQIYSLKGERYRYTRYHDGREELYDHKTDPYEWTNLAGEKKYKSIKDDFSKKLDKELNLVR